MGSGKTSLGKIAAEKAGIPFCDMDGMIELQQNKSLSQIFAEKGEKHFRQLEYDYLRNIPLSKDMILATGGGVACFDDNMNYMNSVGKTIFINLTPEQLKVRLEATDMDSRPLLKGKRNEELLDYITSKLTEREPFYLQANYVITGEDEEITEQIIKIIQVNS